MYIKGAGKRETLFSSQAWLPHLLAAGSLLFIFFQLIC
jgi:hypothetical protein